MMSNNENTKKVENSNTTEPQTVPYMAFETTNDLQYEYPTVNRDSMLGDIEMFESSNDLFGFYSDQPLDEGRNDRKPID